MTRVPTSIEGFDELIGGGFNDGDVILITGGPGTGKTTFGVEFLVKGITEHNESAVFVTMEENPSRVIKNMWQYGWDLERLIKENKLRIIKVDPIAYGRYVQKAIDSTDSAIQIDAGTAIIENLVLQIQKQIEEIGATRMFIDSITSLKLATEPTTVRHSILELVRNIESLHCTTLLSSEYHNTKEQFMVEEYLAEGVIRLHIFRVGGEKVRGIEILKMRGIKHDEQVHPYNLQDDGFVVYPTENIHMDTGSF